jgi:hypothetical protein
MAQSRATPGELTPLRQMILDVLAGAGRSIGVSAAAILMRHHGPLYFDWSREAVNSISSNTPSTPTANRPTKANTPSRRKNPIYPRLMPCSSTSTSLTSSSSAS